MRLEYVFGYKEKTENCAKEIFWGFVQSNDHIKNLWLSKVWLWKLKIRINELMDIMINL